MAIPKPDHPWYGRKNRVNKKARKIADALLDREIERAAAVESFTDPEELMDIAPIITKGVEHIEGGTRRVPVRYYDYD